MRAVGGGADVVVFPEMTLTGFSMDTRAIAEDPENSFSSVVFSELARTYRVFLVVGIVFRHGDKAINSLVTFSPEGEKVVQYTKIHPFSFAQENLHYLPGSALAWARVEDFIWGFSICYDLRFPELYSALSKEAEVLTVIANWPQKRAHHWKSLLQARAIENQAFVIGVNRVGKDGNGLDYEKSSYVVNPNGDFIDPVSIKGDTEIFELDKGVVQNARERFPVRQDRRPELYKQLI